MKRILVLVAILLMGIFLIVGCLKRENDSVDERGNDPQNENPVEDTEDDNMINKRISQNGTYVGQADNNFIEIQVDNGPMTLMMTEETGRAIEEINENDKVDFVYYKNEDGQYILASIAKKNEDQDAVKTDTGTYVGQLDNFSIEIQIEETSKVFINYEMDKLLKDIEQGDRVEIKYTKNEQGQLDLKALKKVE